MIRALCIHADADGVSHLTDVALPAARKVMTDGVETWQGRMGALSCLVAQGPRGDFGDWHCPPGPGLSVTVAGEWEIEAGDGTRRRLGSGDVLVMLDTEGQGHRSRALTGDGCAVIGVALADTARAELAALLAAALAEAGQHAPA